MTSNHNGWHAFFVYTQNLWTRRMPINRSQILKNQDLGILIEVSSQLIYLKRCWMDTDQCYWRWLKITGDGKWWMWPFRVWKCGYKFHAVDSAAFKWRRISIHYFLWPRLRISCSTFKILDRLCVASAATAAMHMMIGYLNVTLQNIRINSRV